MKEKSKRYFKLFALDLQLAKRRIKPRLYQQKEMLTFLFLKNTCFRVHGLFLEVFSPTKQ